MVGGKMKFLIVDDNAGFRRTIRAFLPAGIITECEDGAAALACYQAERPDWVLMDIEMRGMDGFTATRRMKELYPEAHVIIISNHGEEEFRRAARESGCDRFVHKAHLEELTDIFSRG